MPPRKLATYLVLVLLVATTASVRAYERPVHFSVTLQLAELVGFSATEAYEIAKYNQDADDDPARDPMKISNFSARRDFHFVSKEREAELRQAVRCNGSAVEPQGRAIGELLHAVQDTYSHRDFLSDAAKVLGHIFSGHTPDKPWTDPAAFESMYSATFEELIRFRKARCGTEAFDENAARLAFGKLKPIVESWTATQIGQGAGDSIGEERWNAMLPKLFGDSFERYTVDRLTDYLQWSRSAHR